MVDGCCDDAFVDGYGEGLADMNVVEWPVKVVHGDIVYRQLRNLGILMIGQGFSNLLLFGWYGFHEIDLIGLVG